jgi:MscS family membrane protein
MFEQYIANDYLRTGLILLAVFVVLRFIIWIIQKVFVQLTSKTKTDIDDIIVEKSSKPITILVFLIGVRIALGELPLEESLMAMFVNVLYTMIAITFSYLAFVVVNLIFMRGMKKVTAHTESDLDDSLVNLLNGVIKVVWFILTLLYLLDMWGIEIGPFLAGLGIGGLALAFALQSSLANIFAGISIILDKTIKIGDIVTLDDGTSGEVFTIGLRSTRIKSFDNEIMILPNSKVADSKIQNITLPEPKSRVVIPFGVAYGADVDQVKKIVIKEIKTVKNAVKKEEPIVRFLEMGDSSINFKVYFNVDSYKHRANAIDEANTKIYNALNKAKIEIPFPQMDVHLIK